MMMDGGMTAWGWLWPVVMLAGVALVVYVLVRLVRDGTSKGAREHAEQRPSAREVLDERYARGELDDEEYERRRRNLT